MEDYRGKAEASPVVWCVECQKLVSSKIARIMKTVYYVTPDGVYPYGVCLKKTIHRSAVSFVRKQHNLL